VTGKQRSSTRHLSNTLLVLILVLLGVIADPAVAGVDRAVKEDPTHSTDIFDLSGRAMDPFTQEARATVLIFLNPECPISNRYAPEIQRLAKRFANQGAVFWLVYPDADLTRATIQKHLHDFGYTIGALRDPNHVLVRRARAQVTPEAAVFNPKGHLVYQGRIDDRFVDFGKERARPTTHDLKEAVDACLANRPPPRPTAKAVGCYITQ
jgi:hypothetical protein